MNKSMQIEMIYRELSLYKWWYKKKVFLLYHIKIEISEKKQDLYTEQGC